MDNVHSTFENILDYSQFAVGGGEGEESLPLNALGKASAINVSSQNECQGDRVGGEVSSQHAK
jgi:hypothetical protein